MNEEHPFDAADENELRPTADRSHEPRRDAMDSLALTFTSGWASGVNAYLVVLVLGVADRVGHLSGVPDVLAT